MALLDQADLADYLKAAFIAGGKAVDNIYLTDLCTQISRLADYLNSHGYGASTGTLNITGYYQQTFDTPALTWNVPHSLSSGILVWNLLDADGVEVQGSVTVVDDNNLLVTWAEAQAGTITVISKAAIGFQMGFSVAALTWDVAHNQNGRKIVWALLDESGNQIGGRVSVIDRDNLLVEFAEVQAGSIIILGGSNAEYLLVFPDPVLTWTVPHDMGNAHILWKLLDHSGSEIQGAVTIIDDNNLSVAWAEAQAGSIMVLKGPDYVS
jgi:DNA-binding beta-propeller fold protein YncE